MEDLALTVKSNTKTIDILEEIRKQSTLIVDVSLLDRFEDTKTFHLVYQHKDKNLTKEDAVEIRVKILKALKEKFDILPKD